MINTYRFAYESPRKLKEVVVKLEPLSRQQALAGFLCNIDNTKTLAGFVQELANAITDYQVWAASLTMSFNEHLARFPYNKGCMKGQGKSTVIPETFTIIP